LAVPRGEDDVSTPPAIPLQRAISGGDDHEVMAWLQTGLAAWYRGDDDSPLACLGLPATRDAIARLIRDTWLREAARHVPGATNDWQRAKAIVKAISRAQRLRSQPTTPLELALKLACESGAPLLLTRRRVHQIISEAEAQENFADGALRLKAS
jgi:hypothetical protein